MLLYADEDFSHSVVAGLCALGRDVITAQGDGLSGASDPTVLARAHALGRAVLTHNRRHYERLHAQAAVHSGILTAKQHPMDPAASAGRIHAALAGLTPGRWCIRVNRPSP
jgi:hypothetical protein